MFIQEEYLEQARKIHRECPVVDAHFDLAAEVYERRLAGEQGVVEQRYLPRFEEAGLNIVVSSIYHYTTGICRSWGFERPWGRSQH